MKNWLGNLDFGNWAYGLIAAFIGGGAGAMTTGLASIIVDPHDFNLWEVKFWKIVTAAFVIGGFVPFFTYLHQQPLPKLEVREETTKSIGTFEKTVVQKTLVTVPEKGEEKEKEKETEGTGTGTGTVNGTGNGNGTPEVKNEKRAV